MAFVDPALKPTTVSVLLKICIKINKISTNFQQVLNLI